MKNPVSAETWQTAYDLANATPVADFEFEGLALNFVLSSDALWAVFIWPNQTKSAFRLVYSLSGNLALHFVRRKHNSIFFKLKDITGNFSARLDVLDAKSNIIHYHTEFTPLVNVKIPYWPKDILNFTKGWELMNYGKIHAHQIGNRSAILYTSLTFPETGSIFYFQNLSALNNFFQDTKTKGRDLVGGEWPEIGFALPCSEEAYLQKDETYALTDAYFLLTTLIPLNPTEINLNYLEYLALIYPHIPKPKTVVNPWLGIAENVLKDLENHAGCWMFGGGKHYLNAYVSDYKSPPESMVQLAVLLPLIEYTSWKGEDSHPLITKIKDGLKNFYKEDIGTIVRWLPALESNLDYSEEQKIPNVMDSWYLHHPLMNLARLAQMGDQEAENLLMKCVPYVIKVAHTFNYRWPVFYKMDTLDILKAETAEGAGGEKDVPGTYAELMLQIYTITGDKAYLKEAMRSAEELVHEGFELFYQANNTAYSAVGMLKLYKLTKDSKYLDISYACIAAIFKNIQLWDHQYGHGKHFPSFFSVFPLKDAPYTAAYEEFEVYAALYHYYQESLAVPIRPSVKLLLAEFIRYMISRLPFYFPSALPPEMISEEVKTGEIDKELWIPLEDLPDGWDQAGTIGQEVYGAGLAFGVIPRQFYKIPKEQFYIFIDYPLEAIQFKPHQLHLKIGGGKDFPCTLQIILIAPSSYAFKLFQQEDDNQISLRPLKKSKSLWTYQVCGQQEIKLTW